MNNNIDLTEERVFRDNQEKSDFHKVPWKSDKSFNSELNDSFEFNDIRITNNNINNSNTNNYNNRNNIESDTVDFVIDEHIEDTILTYKKIKSKYTENKYDKKDIFGCKREYTIRENTHCLPWRKEYKDTKDIEVSSLLIEKDIRENTSNHLFQTPKEKCDDACWFVENMIDSRDLYQFHKDLSPFRNYIPWEYISGEKNPLNTWNLEEDFEDKNIVMPTDSFFLRNPEYQQEVQLSLN